MRIRTDDNKFYVSIKIIPSKVISKNVIAGEVMEITGVSVAHFSKRTKIKDFAINQWQHLIINTQDRMYAYRINTTGRIQFHRAV